MSWIINLFSISLDDILGGGLYSGEQTEIFGSPGVGKTQVNVHAPLHAPQLQPYPPPPSAAPTYLISQDHYNHKYVVF